MDPAERAAQYQGQPMLRLLDAWVLDLIGALDDPTAASLQAMAPRLAKTFGVEAGSWQAVVVAAMHLPETMPADIQRLWQRNLDRFVDMETTPDPYTFAVGVVDSTLR